MHIQIIDDNRIIIDRTEYEYLKCSGRVLVNGINDNKIIEALKYLFFHNDASKPMTKRRSYRDIRRDARPLGIIYLNAAGLYVAITSGLKIEFFMYEKLAKFFILTEGHLTDLEHIPLALRKDSKKVLPGCFNMVGRGAGFTFAHRVNCIEAFDIDFNRRIFSNYIEAERFILNTSSLHHDF